MKPILLTIIGLIIFSLNLSAKQIDENTAKLVGRNFISANTNSNSGGNIKDLQLVYKAEYKSGDNTNTGNPIILFYVFNISSNGFVIVSGDDVVIPILGYSVEQPFTMDNQPKNLSKWLEGYKKEIGQIIEDKLPAGLEIMQEWANLLQGVQDKSGQRTMASVSPLMQTKWDQSPYYNAYCPGGSVTGCVATAMAQVMKYWNYPVTGTGFHSYNHQTYGTLSANFASSTYSWGSMPNTINSPNNAIANLMYDVGISVNMNYSPQVSGAYVISAQSPVTNCSEYALKTYFGYKPTLQGVQRANYSQAQWLNLIKSELDASRPVLYAGFGSGGGHAFVADGYDNNDFIHFNWGWGGAYDGYFHINALNPNGTGTGGGSGSYNSGHQAVVGIEPPAGNQTYSMELYNYVIPTPSTIGYGQAFTVSTNLLNSGTNTFTGDYTVAIFDNNYNFIDYVETLTNYTLQGGYVYTNNLTFSTTGMLSMVPGTYYAGVFYRPTSGNWIQVSNSGIYTNLVQINVVNQNNIELNSAITVSPGTTLIQGQAASVNLNIVNDGVSTFLGVYSLDLFNLNGTFAQSIGTYNETNGLPGGYTYLAPYLTFNTPSITVAPGTYLLAVQHNPNNTGWQLTGSSYFTNPITITVVAPALQPDIYEINNSVTQSYQLPVNFSGNNTSNNTVGSNCHITSDNDHYKITLPSGYNYTVSPRLHDSYNSGNSNVYTLDALFSYSTDGITWSNTYDDIMTGNITVNNGGTVYFHVAPYFAGETGTYLLDISLSRSQIITSNDKLSTDNIRIYPNPATHFIGIDLNEFEGSVQLVNIQNTLGQIITDADIHMSGNKIDISLHNFSNGVYLLHLETTQGVLTKKIIISK